MRFAACVGAVAGGLFGAKRRGTESTVLAGKNDFFQREAAFSPTEFRPFTLISATDESPDTKILRFSLPDADQQPGMVTASCICLKFTDSDGKEVVRPYTPITKPDQRGFFEIMIKKYPGSKMGTHLHSLRKGQTIDVKGPFEKIRYKPGKWKHIGMIAGGTGIAPVYQVIREVTDNRNDSTEISLIYANNRKEDVLLGNELNEVMMHKPQFSPYFMLLHPPRHWMGGVGYVTRDVIKAFMPPPTRPDDTIIMVCGPPPMMKAVCGDKDYNKSPPTQGELTGILKDMGYSPKQIFKF